jgi:hypothetical protein
MKLSELVEKFKEDIYIDDGSCGDISFDISESSHGYYHISMDEAEGKSPYSCKYRIMVNEKDEKVALVTIDGKKWDNKLILGGLYGFDAFMFKVYSAGMTVEKDVDQVDTHYGHDED